MLSARSCRFYKDANVSREDLLELLSSLMKGAVRNVRHEYVKQLEEKLQLRQLTAANLTSFMQNVGHGKIYCNWAGFPRARTATSLLRTAPQLMASLSGSYPFALKVKGVLLIGN